MIVAESEILDAAILVVDDEEANVRLLAQGLRDAGYTRVSSTLDPTTVCALQGKNRYDMILLDLQMPAMDGFQVMAGLRSNDADGCLAILAVTAQPRHKLLALQAGAKDFVAKPFDLVEVKARVRNMLEIRLLHRRLEESSKVLEAAVRERTAELRESEARYRSLTELATDWYWEQDEAGNFSKVSGPVLEMLGIRASPPKAGDRPVDSGWDEGERRSLMAAIESRQPFLEYVLSRVNADGRMQRFQVSGEPVFSKACRFIGYRGIGVELRARA